MANAAFDQYQFADRKQYPVDAHFAGPDEWQSPGISFDDYSRMQTQQRKQSAERRLPTPEWAVNDSKMRALLVRYMETRALFKCPQPGTEQERLRRAEHAIAARRPKLAATLDKLSAEYVVLTRRGGSSADDLERRQLLARQIENIDTQLVQTANGFADKVVGVIYYYYRCGLDSVGVGTQLGMKPPQVRQMLWRLARDWEKMNS